MYSQGLDLRQKRMQSYASIGLGARVLTAYFSQCDETEMI